MTRALIVVDVQNDFLPGGSLAVNGGDEIVPVINRLMNDYEVVVATQDWHPYDHRSFASHHPEKNVGDLIELDGLEQILWPVHCVQGTHGAEFATELDASSFDVVIQKGTDRNIDSYSGFFDNARRKETDLSKALKARGVHEVDIVGLATDYCVKFTAMDANELGYDTRVLTKGVRGVNLHDGDIDRALEEMQSLGISLI